MEVLYGQEVLSSVLYPLFFSQELTLWTVAVSARVVRYLQMTAAVALIHMTAKGSSPAYLNGMHGPQLIAGQMRGLSIVRAVLTEYVRHLDAVRCTHRSSGYDYEACSIALSNGLVTCARFKRLTWR